MQQPACAYDHAMYIIGSLPSIGPPVSPFHHPDQASCIALCRMLGKACRVHMIITDDNSTWSITPSNNCSVMHWLYVVLSNMLGVPLHQGHTSWHKSKLLYVIDGWIITHHPIVFVLLQHFHYHSSSHPCSQVCYSCSTHPCPRNLSHHYEDRGELNSCSILPLKINEQMPMLMSFSQLASQQTLSAPLSASYSFPSSLHLILSITAETIPCRF